MRFVTRPRTRLLACGVAKHHHALLVSESLYVYSGTSTRSSLGVGDIADLVPRVGVVIPDSCSCWRSDATRHALLSLVCESDVP
jgi:hypothetical protein